MEVLYILKIECQLNLSECGKKVVVRKAVNEIVIKLKKSM